jgi:hypothetical protein
MITKRVFELIVYSQHNLLINMCMINKNKICFKKHIYNDKIVDLIFI